jgi:hypothetical protein
MAGHHSHEPGRMVKRAGQLRRQLDRPGGAPGPHTGALIAAPSGTSLSVAGPSGVRVARHADPSAEKRSVGSRDPVRWTASVSRRSSAPIGVKRRTSGSMAAEPAPRPLVTIRAARAGYFAWSSPAGTARPGGHGAANARSTNECWRMGRATTPATRSTTRFETR